MWQTVYEMQRPIIETRVLFNLAFACAVFVNVVIMLIPGKNPEEKNLPLSIIVGIIFSVVAIGLLIGIPGDLAEKSAFYDRIEAQDYDNVIEENALTEKHSNYVFIKIGDENYTIDDGFAIPEKCRVRIYTINELYFEDEPEDGYDEHYVRVDVYSEDGSMVPVSKAGGIETILFPWKDHQLRNILYMTDMALVVAMIGAYFIIVFRGFNLHRMRILVLFLSTAIGFIAFTAFYWYLAVIPCVIWLLVLRWFFSRIADDNDANEKHFRTLKVSKTATEDEMTDIEIFDIISGMQEESGKRTILTLRERASGLLIGIAAAAVIAVISGCYVFIP